MTVGIERWGVAFPALRLPAAAIAEAWRSNAAKGLNRKAVCAFDEDPVTLAVAAARRCLGDDAPGFSALFVGATSLPYDEKPSSASILSGIGDDAGVRVVEIRGSPQAGVQALLCAAEFCAANPGRRAMAIATDAPRAHPSAGADHALGAGAAAFLVGDGEVVAALAGSAAVSLETFGSRFRRAGERFRDDLELRVDEDAASLRRLTEVLGGAGDAVLAIGGDAGVEKLGASLFGGGGTAGLWVEVGDLGAASAPVAIANALDQASPGARILGIGVGAGATAVSLQVLASGASADTARRAGQGREIGYLEFLKQTGFLAPPQRPS